ncbi:MAG TPA: beta-galactosidase [Gaiellaceae bacterium]|jgi:hypothetical protein|nr:beta-galactosidase [Gaiellaceae bacterium]
MRRTLLLATILAALAAPGLATASPYVKYGVQDDAWLEYGTGDDGTVADRAAQLKQMGVDVVRLTINWRQVEPRRGVYDWSIPDAALKALHAEGIAPLVTLWGTPRWANGGRSQNWAPKSKWTFAAFAKAAAKRYPYVHLWTIWNEPNQRIALRPTSPKTYVQQLLNPAVIAIHNASPRSLVAGGVTAPRAGSGGVSPIDWIAGMKAAHARMDAYAHNPYPLRRGETPTSGGCDHCTTVTMATLPRLLRAVQKSFGTHMRIWLTEYGYQTNPPDRMLGVTYATQARYTSDAAQVAYQAPRVDILIHYLVQDEPNVGRWQSGFYTDTGRVKPALQAFRFPLAIRSRVRTRTVLWGQVRPGGRQTYKLLRYDGRHWNAVGGKRRTTARGYFTRTVNAKKGTRYRIWVPSEHTYSAILTVR